MEEFLKLLAGYTALVLEAAAVVFTACGAVEAALGAIRNLVFVRPGDVGWRKDVFVRFGRWLLFGLQFALAADIVRSVIAPSWNDIGELAAIAVIRTFLNYFLEKDMSDLERTDSTVPT